MLEKVFAYAGPHKGEMLRATAVLFVGVLLGVLPFYFVYQLIVPLIAGESIDMAFVFSRTMLILLCLAAKAVLYGMGLSMSHHAAFCTLFRLRSALKEKIEQLPLGFVKGTGTGSLKKLLVDDVDSLELLMAHALPEGIANLMVPLLVYLVLFFIDWKLALLALLCILLGMTAAMRMYGVGMQYMDDYYGSAQIMNNTIIEYINGMEVVRIFNQDSSSYEKFRKDVTNYRDFTIRWYRACWPWIALYTSVLPCVLLFLLPAGAAFVLTGFSALPDFILAICLGLSIGIPLLKGYAFIPTLPNLNYKISALEESLKAEPLHTEGKAFSGNGHDVCFENVTFSYGEKPAVSGISFTAKEGEKTALIGESGSGKSTLLSLLNHYYDINEGKITLGGQDITEMSLAALCGEISFVGQDAFLFNTSIYENIRMGRQDAAEAEVYAAAEKAQCTDFIKALPQGFETLAGDLGKRLSGGERQRICIARAILKNAPVVVLDEAMSSLDPDNEAKLEAAMSELARGKTLLVIAHKLASVTDADKICVLDRGTLCAQGRHEELLSACPQYRKLWQANEESAKWRVDVSAGKAV